MPNIVEDTHLPSQIWRRHKAKPLSRNLEQLSTSLAYLQTLYKESELSRTISRQLQGTLKNSAIPITRILSLGLGSLHDAKGHVRRLKQLTILLALQNILQNSLGESVEIYAQDPSFTRADQTFLTSLGIHLSRTSSGASLGEAAALISPSTLIYSPFLTIEVYELLLVAPQVPVSHIFGDDFSALQNKWPRHSEERKQIERLVKSGLGEFRRRAINSKDFWLEADESFPMALYERVRFQRDGRVKARI
ncbi:hypothetical protein GQ44DRAFT_730803 [Phaeosphaeriaceae sp. PMI808]|nr:hypothetical protein GQ44DRAFT_730803 [Phaeosphaeriaceae sp. PMI808]